MNDQTEKLRDYYQQVTEDRKDFDRDDWNRVADLMWDVVSGGREPDDPLDPGIIVAVMEADDDDKVGETYFRLFGEEAMIPSSISISHWLGEIARAWNQPI